jgi:Leucine-rich repeat (LRR) protein
VGRLTALETLQILGREGDFSGEIPPEIGRLSELRQLAIAKTTIAGTLPREIGNLTKLEWLTIMENNLSGNSTKHATM